jgi:hypothetical protein
MQTVTAAPPAVDSDPFRAEIEAWDRGHAAHHARPAVLPHELALSPSVACDDEGEPCCDVEWLERHAAQLEGMGHDAALAVARMVKELVKELDFSACHNLNSLDDARHAYYLAARSVRPAVA